MHCTGSGLPCKCFIQFGKPTLIIFYLFSFFFVLGGDFPKAQALLDAALLQSAIAAMLRIC